MKIFEVPATRLIEEVAVDLEKKFNIERPAFAEFVKTGSSRERAPQNESWYYVRTASILYRMAKEGALGVGSLRTYYGGRKNRGVKPHRFRKASGKIIRTALQNLEKAELIEKDKKGRVITPKGLKYLNKKAAEIGEKLKAEAARPKPKPPAEKEKPAGEKEPPAQEKGKKDFHRKDGEKHKGKENKKEETKEETKKDKKEEKKEKEIKEEK